MSIHYNMSIYMSLHIVLHFNILKECTITGKGSKHWYIINGPGSKHWHISGPFIQRNLGSGTLIEPVALTNVV